MSGPALLVTGLAVTGSPVPASWLLAGLTVSAAVGGPLLGVVLDRARRPGRVLAWCLSGYAAGLTLVLGGLGRVPDVVLIGLAVVTGLLGPALTGGWTAQLPLVAAPHRLARATALDSMSYNAAGLAGPAVAGVLATVSDGTTAVLACVVLLLAALPAAWTLPATRPKLPAALEPPARPTPATHLKPPARREPPARPSPAARRESADPAAGPEPVAGSQGGRGGVREELVAGFMVIVGNRVLSRATAGSMVSCAGLAMLVVAAPVLGARLTGESGYGALLLAVTAAFGLAANGVLAAWARVRRWDLVLAWGTAVLGAGMVVAAVAEVFWVAVVAAAVAGMGEGPQLTALFSVRHQHAPAHLRGQVFTTGASLKITSFAAGSALAGPLAAYEPGAALLAGAALQALALTIVIPRRPATGE